MIDWFTIASFEEHLQRYAPIGLALRGLFHGRLAASLTAILEHEPEIAGTDDGGDMLVWVGLVDDTPFSVMAQKRGEITGFELSFPTALVEGRVDIGLLELVTAISPSFHAARYPHVEGLPFVGEGYGVVVRGTGEPFFRSPVRADAEAVAKFLDDPGRYTVEQVKARPTQWIVAGPRTGSAISRVEVRDSKKEADDLATELSVEFGHQFEVFEGQLPR